MELTEEQKTAYSFALADIKNGHVDIGRGHATLWVNRLKREYPELYEYAISKLKE